MASIGGNVKRLRAAAGFQTQKAFADALGWPNTRANELEKDRYLLPDTDTLLQVAKLLRCSLDDLLAGADSVYDAQRAGLPPDPQGRPVATAGDDERDLLQAYRDADAEERSMILRFARSLKAVVLTADGSTAPPQAPRAGGQGEGRDSKPRARRAGERR